MKKRNKKKTKKSNNTSVASKLLLALSILQFIIIIGLIVYTFNINNTIKDLKSENDKLTKELSKNKRDDNYVFLGDSITDWYPISEFFSDDTPIINSGFAGDKTKDLLNDMDETVYRYNPTKVFIQIGTNDLNCDDSNGDIAYENIVKMIENIKTNRPSAEIYLESIYPVNQTDNEKIVKSTTGKRTNEDIIKVNTKLKEYCSNHDVIYVDIYNALLDDEGNLKLDYTDDGLHLSTEGYSVVSDVLKQYIKEN